MSTVLKGYGGSAAPPVVAVTQPPKDTGPGLPVTGADLGVFIVLGVLLMVAGLGIRMSGKKEEK